MKRLEHYRYLKYGNHVDDPNPVRGIPILLGLGGCMAYDVVKILQKSRQEVAGCSIEIDVKRADKIPKVFIEVLVCYI